MTGVDYETLFYGLLEAEEEAAVMRTLDQAGLLRDADAWVPLGGEENNFSIVANQHTDPTGALVEKLINAIDANLMESCFAAGVEPEGNEAPATMAAAVEAFFGIRQGRLGELTNRELTNLALRTQLIAVGTKDSPCYLVVDHGEGQTPAAMPATFMSLAKSNKLRIPFVQGKFNAGGVGVLQFCGTENLQLIASRRAPAAARDAGDETADLWGFTVVRRLEAEEKRRSSMYVYLAPGGGVPTFSASGIRVLPGSSSKNNPPQPYSEELDYGSVIKLYNYAWKAKSVATTDARFELEKFLHSPCLPIRVTETRDYRANYYSTTVSGIWASITTDEAREDSLKIESGFPASESLTLSSVGTLPYSIVVFKQDVETRRVPHGVFFSINGQVHGALQADFVSRKLEFEWLRQHLLVSVDATQMRNRVREDFFMASRDRIRQNEVKDAIVAQLERDLKQHPGLKALNAARRAQAMQKALDNKEEVVNALNELLKADPALRNLFGLGDRLVSWTGPTEVDEFKGRRFPTFFKLVGGDGEDVTKECPINRGCRVEFTTDAQNDYFDRQDSPGTIEIAPAPEHRRLWNGVFSLRFRPGEEAVVGDEYKVSVSVTDADREISGKAPFQSAFNLRITPAAIGSTLPPGPSKPRAPESDGRKQAPSLDLPNVTEVRKEEWDSYPTPFTAEEPFRVAPDGEGSLDYFVNIDNVYLLNNLRAVKDPDKPLAIYWFKMGLLLCALGMIQNEKQRNGSKAPAEDEGEDDETPTDDNIVDVVNRSMPGLSRVIIPIIKNLYAGPAAKVAAN